MMLPNLILIAVFVGALAFAVRWGRRDPAALRSVLPVARLIGGAAFVLIGLRTGNVLVAGIGGYFMVSGVHMTRRRQRLPL